MKQGTGKGTRLAAIAGKAKVAKKLKKRTFHMNTIVKRLSKTSPLDDRVFKLLLSDDEQFLALAELSTGAELREGIIVDINNELLLRADGRMMRLDNLRETEGAFVNLDAQLQAYRFPFKRHLLHGAFIYAGGAKAGGTYEELKPVISIVFYKGKAGAALFEEAGLVGSLVKTEDDGKQMRLIAVNTAKWRDAPTDEMRAYLSTLRNGILTVKNKDRFDGVDTESATFRKFQNAARIACGRALYEESEERGDDHMATVYKQFISDEERLAAEEKGRDEGRDEGRNEGRVEGLNEGRGEGIDIGLEIIKLLKIGAAVSEVASRFKLPESQVDKYRAAI